jgi:hypothetical protein
VLTPPKENRNNPVTNNHYNSSIISEQQNVKQKNVNNTMEKNEIASAKSSVIANVILAPSSKLFVKVLGYLVF